MNFHKKYLKTLAKGTAFGALFAFGTLAALGANWADPTAVPPGNNASAPITIVGDQTKRGGLVLNEQKADGSYAATGLAVINGKMVIGSAVADYAAKLKVADGFDHALMVRGDTSSFGFDNSKGIVLQSTNEPNNAVLPLFMEGVPVALNAASQANVGIGTAAPSAGLQIVTSGQARDPFRITVINGTSDTSGPDNVFQIDAAGTGIFSKSLIIGNNLNAADIDNTYLRTGSICFTSKKGYKSGPSGNGCLVSWNDLATGGGGGGVTGPQGPAGASPWKLSGSDTYYDQGNVRIGVGSGASGHNLDAFNVSGNVSLNGRTDVNGGDLRLNNGNLIVTGANSNVNLGGSTAGPDRLHVEGTASIASSLSIGNANSGGSALLCLNGGCVTSVSRPTYYNVIVSADPPHSSAIADCHDGDQLTGGGINVASSLERVIRSFPNSIDNNSWACETAGPSSLSCVAMCVHYN